MSEYPYDLNIHRQILAEVKALASDLPALGGRRSGRMVKALLCMSVEHQQPDVFGDYYFFGPLGAILCQLEIYFVAYGSLRRTSLLSHVIAIGIDDDPAPILLIRLRGINGNQISDASFIVIVRKSESEFGIAMKNLRTLKYRLRFQHLEAYHSLKIKEAEAELGSPLPVSYELPTDEEIKESELRDEAMLREENWPPLD